MVSNITAVCLQLHDLSGAAAATCTCQLLLNTASQHTQALASSNSLQLLTTTPHLMALPQSCKPLQRVFEIPLMFGDGTPLFIGNNMTTTTCPGQQMNDADQQ